MFLRGYIFIRNKIVKYSREGFMEGTIKLRNGHIIFAYNKTSFRTIVYPQYKFIFLVQFYLNIQIMYIIQIACLISYIIKLQSKIDHLDSLIPIHLYIRMSIISFSTDDYIVPEWSTMPKYAYHLQIIKQGTIIGNINIKKKPFILIGRNNDICDLCIDNPSISRKHAILQFKRDQDLPYLYDLGGTHGTQVNHHKLPLRAYQKLKPFDLIKFGVSSRYYILRCPQLQHKQIQNEYQSENKFKQILAEKNKELSKQQLKDKYIQMLENDPYYKASNLNKKLQGVSMDGSRNVNGVDWGISDEYQVYAYRSQNQYQIQPDVIRRLPGLDQVQLNKISDYQTNLRKYQQIQSELNQLAAKQKRQYGLQEKLRDKKEKLQKRFVQAVQQLQKSQDWVRVNVFGEAASKIAKKQQIQKQDDTFEDDQFYDRTLTAKRLKKQQKQKQETKQKQKNQDTIFTTQDFWKLQKQFRAQLRNLIQLEKESRANNITNQDHNIQMKNNNSNQQMQDQERQAQQQDDLDAYMKDNNQKLQKQSKIINHERLNQSMHKIEQTKNYLISLIGEQQVSKIENEERGIIPKSEMTEQQKKRRKQIQNKKKIGDVLSRLDIIKQTQEEVDEDDLKVFDYYKNQKQLEEQEQQYAQNHSKRSRPEALDKEQKQYEIPVKRFYPGQKEQKRDQDEQQEDGEQFYDLTKFK